MYFREFCIVQIKSIDPASIICITTTAITEDYPPY